MVVIIVFIVILFILFTSLIICGKKEDEKNYNDAFNVQFPTYNEIINGISNANVIDLYYTNRWYGSILNHYEVPRTFIKLDGKEIPIGDGKKMFDVLYEYFIERQDMFLINFSTDELKIYRINTRKICSSNGCVGYMV